MLTIALSLFFGVKMIDTQTVMRMTVDRCQATSQMPPRLFLRARVTAERIVTLHAKSGRISRGRWKAIAHPVVETYYLDDATSCPKGTIEVSKLQCGSEPEQKCTEDLSHVVTTVPPFEQQKARR